ncbi:MAG: 4Fe-4S binding protein [Candidatus Solibacter usitatus]|nr:4Fe-4S binding protein [Candidatus Solibacter usitatus]
MSSVPAEVEAPISGNGPADRPWRRRVEVDRSQVARRAVQFAFLALNVWIGVQFYHFVRQFETGSAVAAIARPPGVEGWLPIAGLMNTRYFLLTGEVPAIHPAAMFLLLAFLTASILFRKAFCSWLCPVGTLSEYLWKLGRDTFKRNFRLPRWLDIGLRSLKYILFGLFAYAVFSMPAQAIAEFLGSPYGVVADVKMLNFFRYMGAGAAVTLGVLVIASIFVQNFWCRYLCPYGALMGLAALLSPLRIRRNVETCIDCAKCVKACPSRLPVDQLVQVRSAECLGCLECVAACPVEDTLHMTFAPARKPVPAWVMAAGVALVFLGVVGFAQASGHWHSAIPDWMYRELIPRAHEYAHPR